MRLSFTVFGDDGEKWVDGEVEDVQDFKEKVLDKLKGLTESGVGK